MGYLADQRKQLGERLAAGVAVAEWCSVPSTIGALPALIVEPAALWLDARAGLGGGPAGVAPLGARVTCCVSWAEPDQAVTALEDLAEAVLDALPDDWLFLYGEMAGPVAAGEVGYLAGYLYLSKKVSLKKNGGPGGR